MRFNLKTTSRGLLSTRPEQVSGAIVEQMEARRFLSVSATEAPAKFFVFAYEDEGYPSPQ